MSEKVLIFSSGLFNRELRLILGDLDCPEEGGKEIVLRVCVYSHEDTKKKK